MKPIRNILAATDLSAPARDALARAFQLAGETGAQLTLMHAVSIGVMAALHEMLGTGAPTVEQRIVDDACRTLRELADELGQTHGVSAAVRVLTGAVVQEIVDQTVQLDADLLVVGARGEGFMRHLMLGSTAERMLGVMKRPVLVVRQPPDAPYRRVLVPIDFSMASEPSLQTLRVLAPRAEIILLHAFELPFEGKLRYAGIDDAAIHALRIAERSSAFQQMEALQASAGIADQSRIIVRHGDACSLIREVQQQERCDLIALGKHGRNRIKEMLLGSVTRHVLSESDCDVLVVGDSISG
ncbi:universal stress protein [Methyloversatilis sp. XJ19-13]|uniref:universal stress protein n=1 Tax=Methyloversatilis sp. XJ19-13 TaxID=2963430 RepID=UPI00211BC808|nr:universal stress protein [Methyloversatilis sp. XJ19-13]MCQ9374129.1 universal stress protein [Methyloversatilis sp. XJ19-13]